MRRPEDYSRRAARPSLLTPAQQAEAARNRILTNLQEGGTGQRRPALRRALLWGGCGALVLAAGALWFLLRSFSVAPISGAGVPVATVQAEAAAGGVDPAMPVVAAPAAATIEDGPAAAPPGGMPAARPDNLLPLPVPAFATPPHAVPSVSSTSVATAVQAAPQRSATRSAVQKIDHKIVRSQTTDVVADRQTQLDAERDVTLLQALVAHDQGEPDLDAQLAACRHLASAEAALCRQRLCRGRAGTGAACTVPTR